MPKNYTVEEAKKYVAKHIDDITLAWNQSKEVPDWGRNSKRMFECWKAGCWLNIMLERHLGATEKEAFEIGFAHGQRSCFSDTWEWGGEIS